ncbi:transposase [Stakelama sp. CBK3Z-3]|uniref:Transposase n=1 Tax=Stakelama flava TaxID=2860338 RepID=A0ABS6XIW9_9SPHN|nr:transposase [Stakelama flava]MBW4330153.1 transposase [Stakelama flava]
MPRLIDTSDTPAIDFDAFTDALDASTIDIADEAAFATLAPLLAALGNNRDFLADAALEALKRDSVALPEQRYGPQVLLLRPPDSRFVLRANFWPAADDAVMRASGPESFFYGVAHNHNFAFLTHGYLGPGYESDYWAFDPGGEPGERAGLRFLGRERLAPGTTMLTFAHRDVHRQLAPAAFSVSLNILARAPGANWRDQYLFDVDTDSIAGQMAVLPSEALVTLAAHCSDNGRDLAMDFAARHPCARMRAGALAACIAANVPGAIRLAERSDAAIPPERTRSRLR